MATLNYTQNHNTSCCLIFPRLQKAHFRRSRLSIAPSTKAKGAVGNRFGSAKSSVTLHAPTATAARHEVAHSIILIRTLTKSNYLFKGDLK